MGAEAKNTQIEVVETSPPVTTYCMKKTTENGSFVENIKDYFNEFINTPYDEHKVCFKHTVDKVYNKFTEFTEKTFTFKEGEVKGEAPVAPLQTDPKN